MNEDLIKERLRKENADFCKLEAEHKEFGREVDRLSKLAYLSTEESLLFSELKKKKLKAKDKMEEILRIYKKSLDISKN